MLAKHELLKVPLIGWTWYFLEIVFCKRRWEEDRKTVFTGLQRLKDYPECMWVSEGQMRHAHLGVHLWSITSQEALEKLLNKTRNNTLAFGLLSSEIFVPRVAKRTSWFCSSCVWNQSAGAFLFIMSWQTPWTCLSTNSLKMHISCYGRLFCSLDYHNFFFLTAANTLASLRLLRRIVVQLLKNSSKCPDKMEWLSSWSNYPSVQTLGQSWSRECLQANALQ